VHFLKLTIRTKVRCTRNFNRSKGIFDHDAILRKFDPELQQIELLRCYVAAPWERISWAKGPVTGPDGGSGSTDTENVVGSIRDPPGVFLPGGEWGESHGKVPGGDRRERI